MKSTAHKRGSIPSMRCSACGQPAVGSPASRPSTVRPRAATPSSRAGKSGAGRSQFDSQPMRRQGPNRRQIAPPRAPARLNHLLGLKLIRTGPLHPPLFPSPPDGKIKGSRRIVGAADRRPGPLPQPVQQDLIPAEHHVETPARCRFGNGCSPKKRRPPRRPGDDPEKQPAPRRCILSRSCRHAA